MGGGGGGGGGRGEGRCIMGRRPDRQSPFLSPAGPLKVAAEVSKRLLKGFLAADCEASKGRKREMIDRRSQ